ncbi:short chain dehydrogenase [Neurospora intermedia]|uniref:Short chain dehydrogenase n=1 Tax=Neurospora intermedia TaxID=5142 RepID=A0ABR3DPP8_NEUIN
MTPPLVALITAGSAGLGAATARLFARNGIRLVISYDINGQRAYDLVEELTNISPLTAASTDCQDNYVALKVDLAEKDQISQLVDNTIFIMGKLDIVFSNGTWIRLRDINDLDDNVNEEDWDMCFNMNVKSHLWLMHAAKPYLDQTEGVFITTACLSGVIVSGSSLAYSVTKAAQIHLAKGLAHIAAPKIRVNTVSPGPMLTDWGLQFPPEKQEEARERSKLNRLDVAEQVLCFVKSKSVTGVNAIIDGGMAL